MASSRSFRRLYACVTCAALVSCGGPTAAPKPTTVAKPRVAQPAPPPAPKPPSAYERRWQSACEEHGTLGRCPAPFDRPGLFLDTNESVEHPVPVMCGDVDQPTADAARTALQAKRAALRRCFRGADPHAWVDVDRAGTTAPGAAPGLPARTRSCVAKIVERALPTGAASDVKRVVVVNGDSAGKGEATLSKESVHAMITAHADEVGVCYDGALEVWPGLRGRMAPSVVVWFDGSVALVRTLESSFDNAALECCINTAVSGWHFEPPAGGSIAIVTLPFVLGAQP